MRKPQSPYTSVRLTDTLQNYVDKISGYLQPDELREFKIVCDIKDAHDWKTISFAGVKRIHDILTKNKNGPTPYLHELLAGSELHLPKPDQRVRLEKRLDKLRLEEENRVYKAMTRDVAPTVTDGRSQSLKHDFRMLNRQLTHMFNFVVTVGAAFAFGYKGSELMLGVTDMVQRMFSGLAVATCVFFADLYFIIRSLD